MQDYEDLRVKQSKLKKMPSYHFMSENRKIGNQPGQLTFSQIWSGFKEKTTSHGVPHIALAAGGIKRIYWVVVILVMIAIALYNVISVSIIFSQRNTNIIINLTRNQDIKFPSVTVCNMNPMRLSRVKNDTSIQDILLAIAKVSTESTLEKNHSAVTQQTSTAETTTADTRVKRDNDNNRGLGGGRSMNQGNNGQGGRRIGQRGPPTRPTSENRLVPENRPLLENRMLTSTQRPSDRPTQAQTVIKFRCPRSNESAPTEEQPVTFEPSIRLDPNQTERVESWRQPQRSVQGDRSDGKLSRQSEINKGLGEQTEQFKISQRFVEALASLPIANRSDLGHQLKDFILECSYNGRTCNNTTFTTFSNAIHGNCFTFNAGFSSEERKPLDDLFQSYKTGSRYGLKLVLNVQQEEYIPELTETAGARLMVHDHYKMPFVEDEGLSLTVGKEIFIGVRKVYNGRLETPYSECLLEQTGLEMYDVFQEMYNTNYTILACQKTCFQKAIIQSCGCAHAQYPSKGRAFGDQNSTSTRICSTFKFKDAECIAEVTLNFSTNDLKCDCPEVCIEESYTMAMSFADWPSIAAGRSTLERIQALAPSINASNLKTNVMTVNVYYEELNQESYFERPAYTITSLLADFGGAIGLWIGMSVVTIFEFIELFIDVFILLIYKCVKGKKPSNKQSSDMRLEKFDTREPDGAKVVLA